MVLGFGSSATPFPPSPIGKLSLFLYLSVCRRPSLLTGEGGEYGLGAKSYDRENPVRLKIIQYSLG